MRYATVRRATLYATNGALVITAIVLAWMAIGKQPEFYSPGLSPGTEFPSLTLADVDGNSVDIDFAGGTGDRLVVFFSSECPFCLQSLPVYWSVSEMCNPSLILAFTDLKGAELAAWWEENSSGFSDWCDSMSIGSVLSPLSLYQVWGTPTHYLIGGDGRVKHHFEGVLIEMPSWLSR